MRLTVVGCSGSLPGPGSAASCYLLEAEAEGRTWRLLLDLGSGALGPLGGLVDLDDLDAVLLTHLHPDHFLDMCGLYVARRYHPAGPAPDALPVHGPRGTADRLAGAYGLDPDPGMTAEFDVRRWADGVPVHLGPFTVLPRLVEHPVEAYALRVTGPGTGGEPRTLVYTGDTDSCPALLELSRGADLLLCEAAYQEGRDEARGIHLTGLRAGELARDAQVASLVLTHLPPWNDPQVALGEALRVWAGPLQLAEPGQQHRV